MINVNKIRRSIFGSDGEYADSAIFEHWDQDTHMVRSWLHPGTRVLDLGAHVGVFSLFCAAWGADVVAVEPGKRNFQTLCENIERTELPVRALNAAAGPQTGQCKVVDSDTATRAYFGEEGTTPVYPLGFFLLQFPGDWIDVLKVDVEGAEYAIFHEGSEPAMRRIDYMTMELHNWPGAAQQPHGSMAARERLFSQIAKTHRAAHPPADSVGGLLRGWRRGWLPESFIYPSEDPGEE